ncbi:DNA-directed DNA polymerase [Tanacetum coccineum]
MMSKERITQARETYATPHKVLTNDDLLTQILIRLPILCIHMFATVSKQWLRIITSPLFTKNRSQITKVDPPVALFVNHIRSLFECDFVSFDPRLQSIKFAMDSSFTLASLRKLIMLRSCSLAMVCFCDVVRGGVFLITAGLRMTFDPTKSPHYKLVGAGRTSYDIDIQIYSSETSKWSLYDFGSSEFTIYEMMIGCSMWTVREQDSFLVINLSGKVVQYNLFSKTLHEIYDCGSNQLDDNHDDNDDDDELPRELQAEHNVYEFISSFASV